MVWKISSLVKQLSNNKDYVNNNLGQSFADDNNSDDDIPFDSQTQKR